MALCSPYVPARSPCQATGAPCLGWQSRTGLARETRVSGEYPEGSSVFRKGLQGKPPTPSSMLGHGRLALPSTPPLLHHPGSDVDWPDRTTPITPGSLLRQRGLAEGAWPTSSLLCFARPGVCGLDPGGGPLAASGPRRSPAASEAKRRRGRRRDAKRAPMAETGSAAPARCPRVSQVRSTAMVQAPGRL